MGRKGKPSGLRRRVQAAHAELAAYRFAWGTDASRETLDHSVEVVNAVFGAIHSEGARREVSRRAELLSYTAAQRAIEAQVEVRGFVL